MLAMFPSPTHVAGMPKARWIPTIVLHQFVGTWNTTHPWVCGASLVVSSGNPVAVVYTMITVHMVAHSLVIKQSPSADGIGLCPCRPKGCCRKRVGPSKLPPWPTWEIVEYFDGMKKIIVRIPQKWWSVITFPISKIHMYYRFFMYFSVGSRFILGFIFGIDGENKGMREIYNIYGITHPIVIFHPQKIPHLPLRKWSCNESITSGPPWAFSKKPNIFAENRSALSAKLLMYFYRNMSSECLFYHGFLTMAFYDTF